MTHNGEVSWWWRSGPPAPRSPLTSDIDCDVAIVGAGFTGLWAARHLLRHDSALRVVILEAKHVGYGASGRNGGWLSGLMPGNRRVYRDGAGAAATRDLQRACIEAVPDVLTDLRTLGIDAAAAHGGHLRIATTPAAVARLREARDADLSWGYRPEEVVELTADATRDHVRIEGARGGLFYPGVAVIDPARTVAGLAAAVTALGATIHEHTPALAVTKGQVTTCGARVRAPHVLVCTEGYTASLLPRRVIPVNSSMIVTRPLTAGEWDAIGWAGREALNDAAHTFIYAQRTSDGRIAIGGRGSPYRFASGTTGDGGTPSSTIATLTARLARYFPDLDLDGAIDGAIDHAWSGDLGVTRDWCATVLCSPDRSLATAFGYAGHGVTAAALAGATLADLTLGRATWRTRLAWVGHRPPRWEPEPLRWLGIHSTYRLFRIADDLEERRGSEVTHPLARLGARLSGLV